VKLRNQILVLLLVFGLAPLLISVSLNLPLVLDRTEFIYQKAHLQNLRADFRDLDQHLASRHEMVRLLAKLPEPGLILGDRGNEDQIDLARARYTGWLNQILSDQRDIIKILFLGADIQERFWLERDERTLTWHPTTQLPERPHKHLLEAGLRMKPGGVMISRIRIDPIAGTRDPRQLMTLDLVSAIGGGPQEAAMGLVLWASTSAAWPNFTATRCGSTTTAAIYAPGSPSAKNRRPLPTFPAWPRSSRPENWHSGRIIRADS